MPNNNHTNIPGRKIALIVEDDLEMNNLLKMTIEQVCDCLVEQIYDGSDALQRIIASQGEIRLVILDLSLPGVSGEDVLDAILPRDITVAIVTADPIAAQRLVGKVSAVFTKPWNRMDFLAKLASLLLADTE